MTPCSLADDVLLSLVHEIRTYLRRSQAAPERSPQERLEETARVNRELERFLGRLSDYAMASYLSKARPLPVEVAIQCAALQFPGHDIDVVKNCMGGRSVPVEMVRSFSELIDNAIKFSNGGAVKISLEAVNGAECCVTISDSGIGLAEEDLERAFGVLARLHSTSEFAGFGLGLPIARRIAEAAGAELSLSPNAGGGLVATVKFPACEECEGGGCG